MGQRQRTIKPILAPSEVFWGDRLQLAREFRGLTQVQLAEGVAASPTLVRYCELGKKRQPATDLVEAFGTVLGFEPGFFYGPLSDVFKDDECSFRHRRTTPERTKTQVRAHASLIAMVVERLRGVFRFPKLNVPAIRASTPIAIRKPPTRAFNFIWTVVLHDSFATWRRRTCGYFYLPGCPVRKSVMCLSCVAIMKKIIFLNQAVESTSRWNFDIVHEVGHIVMHQNMITGDLETEAAANPFASAFGRLGARLNASSRLRPFRGISSLS